MKGIWMVFLGSVLAISSSVFFAPELAVDRQSRVECDFSAISVALGFFHQRCSVYPTTEQGLSALVKKPADFAGKKWIQCFANVPMDPWGKPYEYRIPGQHNPGSFDIFSFGPDGKVSADDIGNWKDKAE